MNDWPPLSDGLAALLLAAGLVGGVSVYVLTALVELIGGGLVVIAERVIGPRFRAGRAARAARVASGRVTVVDGVPLR